MSAKELILDGGLNMVKVHDVAGTDHIALFVSNEPVGHASMLAMLDRHQQHMLMLYLQERLAR